MRTAFIKTLCELAGRDDRIWLLCGDLGYSVLEKFSSCFPGRFLNVGVAEQNMTGIAAGLALSGKIVFTYSIANFPVIRCLEQIRNDVCYHQANVKIVAVGGGLAYGPQGYTHHGVEDLAVMRVLPQMTVLAPGDPVETRLATEAAVRFDGPCYIRLGKANEPVVHQIEPVFRIGSAIRLREGSGLTLVSTGGVLELASRAADALNQSGHSIELLSMPTLQPLDEQSLIESGKKTGGVVSIEEHGLGGLASACAEVLAAREEKIAFEPVRLRREALGCAGSQENLRGRLGVSLETIIEAAGRVLKRTESDRGKRMEMKVKSDS